MATKNPVGRPRKSMEDHERDDTYRADRHGPPIAPLELTKPVLARLPTKKDTKKWIRTAADERAVSNGCRFSIELAEYVEQWFLKYLRFSEGRWAGKPFSWMDWQKDEVFYPLFGWVRHDDELGLYVRRFNRVYIEVPKKNGKSPMGAGVGVYMLAGDGEQGGKVFSVATDKKQASIVHDHAINMVEDSQELQAMSKINRTTNVIHFKPTRSKYSVISGKPSSGKGQEGWNGNCAIADEIHAWQGQATYNTLKWMFASRTDPIFFQITTAGDDMQSVCRMQHEYTKQVADGTIHDDGFLGLIYAADINDDWQDEAVWTKANPSIGNTVLMSEMRQAASEAKSRPSMVSAFKRYRLNIWCTAENPWEALGPDNWNACQEDFTEDDLEGWDCVAGLDLAKTTDMTALALVFKDPNQEGVYRLLNYYFMPADTYEARKGLADYERWKNEGWLELTEGRECDYGYVEERFQELAEKFNITELVFDPWNAGDITSRLSDSCGCEPIKFPQNVTQFTGPSKELEKLVLGADLRHNGNALTAWQASHVTTWEDKNQNIRPVKRKRGDHRTVDGIVAAIMAISRAVVGEEEVDSADMIC